MKYLKLYSFLFFIVFLACKSTKKDSEEIILAQIGEKKISVREFKERSELTIRPPNFKDKKTTLNNLIAEKGKNLIIFENSAHFPMIEEKEQYQDLLINDILKIAITDNG